MAQVTLAQGAEFDTSLALRAKVLSLYSLDTNTDAVCSDLRQLFQFRVMHQLFSCPFRASACRRRH